MITAKPGDIMLLQRVEELERENAELREACAEAVKVLERMDTLRHVDPAFPALDRCRAALAGQIVPSEEA